LFHKASNFLSPFLYEKHFCASYKVVIFNITEGKFKRRKVIFYQIPVSNSLNEICNLLFTVWYQLAKMEYTMRVNMLILAQIYDVLGGTLCNS
jgi:hypothetical protein